MLFSYSTEGMYKKHILLSVTLIFQKIYEIIFNKNPRGQNVFITRVLYEANIEFYVRNLKVRYLV